MQGDKVLLGWQKYGRDYKLSTFGGKEDEGDRGNPAATAVREAFEETLGMVFYDPKSRGYSLNAVDHLKSHSLALSSPDNMFLLYVVFVDGFPENLPALFSERRKQVLSNGDSSEKDSLEWVSKSKWKKMMDAGMAYGGTAQMVNSAIGVMKKAHKRWHLNPLDASRVPWLLDQRW